MGFKSCMDLVGVILIRVFAVHAKGIRHTVLSIIQVVQLIFRLIQNYRLLLLLFLDVLDHRLGFHFFFVVGVFLENVGLRLVYAQFGR